MSYKKKITLFGIRVRATRRALNLTQKDLAQRAGITVRCLHYIEHPDKTINKSILLSTAIKIADALNVNILDLFNPLENNEDRANTKEEV